MKHLIRTLLVSVLAVVALGACQPDPVSQHLLTRTDETPAPTTTTVLPFCTATQGAPCWFNPNVWVPPTPALPDCTHYGENDCVWHGQELEPAPPG